MPEINRLSAYDDLQSGDQLPVFSTGAGDTRKMGLGVLATWLSTALVSLTATSFLRVSPKTTANLPSASTAGEGARAFVTDATSTTFNATLAGGGANKVPVFSDGAIWRIG